MNPRAIYECAIDSYGIDAQVDMFIEECSEAIVAIQHYRRGRCNIDDVCSELADVHIMTEQMSILFDRNKFDKMVDMKLNRLAARLDNKTLIYDDDQQHTTGD